MRSKKRLPKVLLASLLLLGPHGLLACPPPPVKVKVVGDLMQRFPGEAFLYSKLGEFESEQGHWTQADAAFAQARSLDPDWTDTYFYQGISGSDSGRMSVAAEALQRFFRLPDISERRDAKIAEICQVFPDPLVHEILAESRPNLEEAKAAEARALAALGRRKEADQIFAELSKQSPNADYVLGRARSLEAAGDWVGALKVLNTGLAALGSLPVLEDAAADAELKSGRETLALGRLERLCRSAALRPQRLEEEARILKKMGRTAEAKVKAAEAARELAAQPSRQRLAPASHALQARLEKDWGMEPQAKL